ncbi:MAG: twin-arginine translocase TatA/TatE family subunit [Candidatus Limnocylindria bacterium]
MFGIGTGELLLLLLVALVVLGPERMPKLARDVGRALADFRRTSDELREEFLNADKLAERMTQATVPGAAALPEVTPADPAAHGAAATTSDPAVPTADPATSSAASSGDSAGATEASSERPAVDAGASSGATEASPAAAAAAGEIAIPAVEADSSIPAGEAATAIHETSAIPTVDPTVAIPAVEATSAISRAAPVAATTAVQTNAASGADAPGATTAQAADTQLVEPSLEPAAPASSEEAVTEPDETAFDREAREARERLHSEEHRARAEAEGWEKPTDEAGNSEKWA